MGVKGFFKTIWGGIRKVLPFLKKALDNDLVKMVLISKFGKEIVELITELINAADDLIELTNEERHAYVRENAYSDAMAAGMSGSDLDIHIKTLVAEKRGKAAVGVA